MNYIKQLQAENNAQHRELVALREGLNRLRCYLHSPKFCCGNELDSYVNIVDVLAYLRDAEDAALVTRESNLAAS